MVALTDHLRWGAYCCLLGAKGRGQRRWLTREWSMDALSVVDAMIVTRDLRSDLRAFRIVFEARKLIETGLKARKRSFMLVARDELLKAVAILESDDER